MAQERILRIAFLPRTEQTTHFMCTAAVQVVRCMRGMGHHAQALSLGQDLWSSWAAFSDPAHAHLKLEIAECLLVSGRPR